MIAVTERAKQELKKMLSDRVDNPLAVLRLTKSNEGLGLILDVEMPGDKVVKHEDSKVLVVETPLADGLQGVTLDVEDTSEGPELVVIKEKAP
jgi:Fe-S cluster assembly iron-binding protein IscA